MRIIIEIGVIFMNFIYCFHKLAPVKNRVTVISRQSSEPSVDVRILFRRLNELHPEIETRMMYRMIPPGIGGKISYLLHMIGPEMHALATSKVVLLEGYSIPVSILKHKKKLKVIQMWHALGIFKRFGRMVEGNKEGYNKAVIEGMRMHRNYDAVLASSGFCRPFYAQAFGYTEDHIKIIPLPRVDLLRDSSYHEAKAKEIYKVYPELKEKKNILYTPTHRKDDSLRGAVDRLLAANVNDEFNIIVKLHPIDRDSYKNTKAMYCGEFSSFELISVADYVVTDYSAFVFEAAAADRPVFFYAYDMDDYINDRGFCIDYMNDMPTRPVQDAVSLFEMIKNDSYEKSRVKEFSDKFIDDTPGATDRLVELIRVMYNS